MTAAFARRRIALVSCLFLTLATGGLLAGCGKGAPPATRSKPAARYYCPMHPSYTSDQPGDCPICNMRLVPIPSDSTAIDSTSAAARAGMPAHDHGEQGEHAAGAANAPAGQVAITLSPEVEQRIGVRTVPAARGAGQQVIRAAGRVAVDESRVHHVHTKVEGWVDEVYVATTGQRVRAGEPLLRLYSPDLVSTQEEYLLALKNGGDSSAIAASARRRLELWDVSERQLDEIARTGVAKTKIDIASHAGGIVLEKRAVSGMRVMPGEELYTIADLSQVWVTGAVYEYELPLVQKGQEATVTLAAAPGRVFRGRIAYVYPYLDPATRTAEVRVEFKNSDVALQPGMFATIEIQVPVGDVLTIPADAVLDSGEEQVVLVAQGLGRYEPRQVQIGQRLGEGVVVLSGIAEGEQVVTGAQFLIDSESRLKAALSGMGGGHAH